MALVFPRTPATYRAFFKEFADRHKYINNNDKTRQNFSVISFETAASGLADNDVRDFLNKLRSGAKLKQTANETSCAMILIEMDGDSNEGEVRMNMRRVNASFAIVTKPQDKSPEKRDEAKDICYATGLSIVHQIKDFFLKNIMLGKIYSINDESIRIVADDLIGWRFDITYLVMRDAYTDGSLFDGLVVEELVENDRSV